MNEEFLTDQLIDIKCKYISSLIDWRDVIVEVGNYLLVLKKSEAIKGGKSRGFKRRCR